MVGQRRLRHGDATAYGDLLVPEGIETVPESGHAQLVLEVEIEQPLFLTIELHQFASEGRYLGLDGDDAVPNPEVLRTRAQAVWVLDGGRYRGPDLGFEDVGGPPAVAAADTRDRPARPATPVDRGAVVHLPVVRAPTPAAAHQAPQQIDVPLARLPN